MICSIYHKIVFLLLAIMSFTVMSCSHYTVESASTTCQEECKYPPYLQEGDKVAIITPAGKIDTEKLDSAMSRLQRWKLSPFLEPHAAGSYNDYSGTIEERLSDLQQAFDDPDVKAILCSRGGYGVVQYLDKIDFTKFSQYPKWLIGYSDITALHCIIQKHGFASLHAPMAEQMTIEPDSDKSLNYLKNILYGTLPKYHVTGNSNNHSGKARGVLMGGNLSVYYGLRSTPYDIPAKGTILFIEDVDESYHSIERMLYNLKLSGVLDNLSGLIIGQMSNIHDVDWMNDKDTYTALNRMLQEYDYPICFGFPTGHVTDNYPLIEGAVVELDVDSNGVDLQFIQ
jgi:muramoyltetrapeptide carboxypeptidase